MRRFISLGIFLFAFIINESFAQVSVGDKGTLSGTVYADYYWFAQSHNEDWTNNNGFWFRRIYLTYDRSLSDHFSTRLRLEMSSPGDFSTNTELAAGVKDAYLKWAKGGHQVLAGISSTPTWGLVEDMWGYRSVVKSPLDLFKFGSSRDFGLSVKGKMGSGDKIGYHFFAGNGNSNKPELNKGKKLMLALSYQLTEHLVVQGYADWNDTTGEPEAVDYYTVQGFAGYQSDKLTLGALYAYQQYDASSAASAKGLDIVSAFANFTFSEKVRGYARVDRMLDPNPRGEDISYLPMSAEAEPTFLVGGVDIKLHENVRLQPNIETVLYSENEAGVQPDADVVPRLTLVYTF